MLKSALLQSNSEGQKVSGKRDSRPKEPLSNVGALSNKSSTQPSLELDCNSAQDSTGLPNI